MCASTNNPQGRDCVTLIICNAPTACQPVDTTTFSDTTDAKNMVNQGLPPPIIGAIIAGAVVLILIAVVVVLWKKRKTTSSEGIVLYCSTLGLESFK